VENPVELATGLVKSPDGYWLSSKSSSVSYPDSGSDTCFAVEDDSFWFAHRNGIITTAMAHFPPPGIVFDVGGGNGFVTAGMVNAGFPSILVEPSLSGIANARTRGLENSICSTLGDAGFPDNSLPAIGLFDVLEHVEDDRAFLSHLHRLLQPGGRLYLSVPAFNWLWSADDVRAGHFRRYRSRTLEERLRESGFRVDYSTYFFSHLVVPLFLKRSLLSHVGLRKRDIDTTSTREHRQKSRPTQKVLKVLSSRETKRISALKRIPFGTSCLAIASK
jgi:SAM-dependent methyltransferase